MTSNNITWAESHAHFMEIYARAVRFHPQFSIVRSRDAYKMLNNCSESLSLSLSLPLSHFSLSLFHWPISVLCKQEIQWNLISICMKFDHFYISKTHAILFWRPTNLSLKWIKKNIPIIFMDLRMLFSICVLFFSFFSVLKTNLSADGYKIRIGKGYSIEIQHIWIRSSQHVTLSLTLSHVGVDS